MFILREERTKHSLKRKAVFATAADAGKEPKMPRENCTNPNKLYIWSWLDYRSSMFCVDGIHFHQKKNSKHLGQFNEEGPAREQLHTVVQPNFPFAGLFVPTRPLASDPGPHRSLVKVAKFFFQKKNSTDSSARESANRTIGTPRGSSSND